MTQVVKTLFARAAVLAPVLLLLSAAYSQTDEESISTQNHSLRLESYRLNPADNGQPTKVGRRVNPRLAHIDAWISSVGAAVAIADIEGIGRPADLCLVDPRNDSVTVMPAPSTERGWKAFALPIVSDGYDARTLAPMGCMAHDVNEDGLTDLLVYYWGRTPILFLQTALRPLSAASFKSFEIFPRRERWFTNAAVFADVDGDGHADLVVGNYFRDGDRILDATATDGAELQHSMSRAFNGGRNRLLLWNSNRQPGEPIFRDASDAFSEMSNGWTLALGAADLSGDLLPEIYVANDFGPDRLLLNRSTPGSPHFEIVRGKRDFFTPQSKVLGNDSFKGMGIDFADINGDGQLDIAVSNIAQPYALLESHFLFVHTGGTFRDGVAPYEDRSDKFGVARSSWAWDVKFADLLNNGSVSILQATGFVKGRANCWPELQELAMGNDELLKHPAFWPKFQSNCDLSGRGHDRLYMPGPDGRYHDAWSAIPGLDRETISRGIALGDVFGDGRLSLAIARQWMPSLFLRNNSDQAGESLVLYLRLPNRTGTRPAIGAKAELTTPNGHRHIGLIDGGNGHSGKRAPHIHFGLGNLPTGNRLRVKLSWIDDQAWAGASEPRPHVRWVDLTSGRHEIVLDSRSTTLPQKLLGTSRREGSS